MKKIFFLLLALTLSGTALATDLTLSWVAPTSYTNGTAIPSGTAITYNVYGANQGAALALIQAGVTGLSNVRTNVDVGTKCYAVTAVAGSQESAQTTPICVTVAAPPPPVPNPPTQMSCNFVISIATGAVTGACTTK